MEEESRNHILKLDDHTLSAMPPEGGMWDIDVNELRALPDFRGMADLAILAVLQEASLEELENYGGHKYGSSTEPQTQTIFHGMRGH